MGMDDRPSPPPQIIAVRTQVVIAGVNVAGGRGRSETDSVEGGELLESRVVAQSAADQVLVRAHACRGYMHAACSRVGEWEGCKLVMLGVHVCMSMSCIEGVNLWEI